MFKSKTVFWLAMCFIATLLALPASAMAAPITAGRFPLGPPPATDFVTNFFVYVPIPYHRMTDSTDENNGQDITLRDVVNHMSDGFGEINTRLRHVQDQFKAVNEHLARLEAKIDQNQEAILVNREALDSHFEDIETLFNDNLKIRRHIGIHVGDEG